MGTICGGRAGVSALGEGRVGSEATHKAHVVPVEQNLVPVDGLAALGGRLAVGGAAGGGQRSAEAQERGLVKRTTR